MNNKVLSEMRREYQRGHLYRDNLSSDPVTQFQQWLQDAVDFQLSDPTAMTISTVNSKGQPSQRIVLLKQFSSEGFTFFTNSTSRKAEDIKTNALVSLHFPWHPMERQVSIEGSIVALPDKLAEEYFYQRPRGSQLAAVASDQSKPIASREDLMKRYSDKQREFEGEDVPFPANWGGYCVVPSRMEFWQGGEHRLHDRFVYEKTAQHSAWSISRLMP